jgi:hypothetical protein
MAWRAASPGIGQAGPGSQVAGSRPHGGLADPAHPLGGRLEWSPSSCAIRLAQPFDQSGKELRELTISSAAARLAMALLSVRPDHA